MIQIVRGHNFVFDPLIVKLDCMFSIVAAKHKEVFDSELFSFSPSHLQASLLQLVLTLKRLGIEQIKHLLIVNL